MNFRLDEPDIIDFEINANGRVYKFQGRIDLFNLEAQRDNWYEVDIAVNRSILTRPVTTFEIHGTVVGQLRSEEPRTAEQAFSSFPQRYALGISDAMQETGKQMTEGLVRGLQTCDHMCSCTSECLSDCPSLCGD